MSKILVVADILDSKQVAIKRTCERVKTKKQSLHIVYFCYRSLRHIQDDAQNIKQAVIDAVTYNAEKSLATLVPDDIDYSFEVVWEKRIDRWINDYA